MAEFVAWPKIKRITQFDPMHITITEKMDGTNGAIIIENGKLIGAQSRNRLIGKRWGFEDNMGFGQWVSDHEEELVQLGDGHHYGEWCGPKIQGNRHGLEHKIFYLFNVSRWTEDRPECCGVVPLLFEGHYTKELADEILNQLVLERGYEPEGIMMYFYAFDKYLKHTLHNTEGKWKEG